ncbi:MAG: amidohydrolase [Chloroflexi bacterium]|nr:amidohydrolase [Chloroflexota bacterium]
MKDEVKARLVRAIDARQEEIVGGPGPTVALLGELDALPVWDHPAHDPETGAVHACCHHAQVAAMLGAAAGLVHSGVLDSLSGRVALIAVPAEEYVEIEERLAMRAEGKLELLAGKAEMLRVGGFDDVDMAMMVHATSNPAEGPLGVGGTTNGMLAKFIRYVGRSTHASSPYDAVNALYAAEVALVAINALRETFRDEDHVRVHPIITRGGDVVSAIPADVRMETFVRASTSEALQDATRKVDRALCAGALALGARLELTTVAGYLPLRQDDELMRLFRANADMLVGLENVKTVGHRSGGTDMGDLGHVMPVLHSFSTGASGVMHGADFRVTDEEVAVIQPAQALAMTVVDLLSNEAAGARRVQALHRPRFSKEQYLAFVRSLARTETFDGAASGT